MITPQSLRNKKRPRFFVPGQSTRGRTGESPGPTSKARPRPPLTRRSRFLRGARTPIMGRSRRDGIEGTSICPLLVEKRLPGEVDPVPAQFLIRLFDAVYLLALATW